jgi:DNA-binding response OmpR family regulator
VNELILLVDDEPSIVQLARMYLEREGFRVESVGDGKAAVDKVERQHPALVVLDVMLPKLDGFEVCRRLRASQNPVAILMLTARDEDIDKILGLELGADDYLTKPFNPRELVARVKAILRRGERRLADAAPLHLGDLTVDPARREVHLSARPLDLRCARRNSIFSSPWLSTADSSSAASSSCKKPGASTSTARRAPWMFILHICAGNLKTVLSKSKR